MAEMLRKVFIRFTVSHSPDVVGYKMYAQANDVPLDRNGPSFDLGMPVPDSEGVCLVDLSSVPGISELDGTYNLGIVSVDDAGNESSMLSEGLENITLDFIAPDPPTAASVIYGS